MSLPSAPHATLADVAIREMRRETVQLPRAEASCITLLRDYQAFLVNRDARLPEAIAERVADTAVQNIVLNLLIEQVRRGAKAPGI